MYIKYYLKKNTQNVNPIYKYLDTMVNATFYKLIDQY